MTTIRTELMLRNYLSISLYGTIKNRKTDYLSSLILIIRWKFSKHTFESFFSI